MKPVRTKFSLTLALLLCFVLPNLSSVIEASDLAHAARSGKLHLVKDTSQYSGLPGGFATIAVSNLASVPVGSMIFYDQAPDIPAGLIDSNVVLDAGNGNRAFGRCTTDLVTWIGLCTFSDGVGTLSGFHARLEVSLKSLDLGTFDLRGTYRFTRHSNK